MTRELSQQQQQQQQWPAAATSQALQFIRHGKQSSGDETRSRHFVRDPFSVGCPQPNDPLH